MTGRITESLKQTKQDVQAAHTRLPELLAQPDGLRIWLKEARYAHIALALTLVAGLWIVPSVVDTVLESVLPASTQSGGFLGMSKRTVAHPMLGPMSVVLQLLFWCGGLATAAALLWKDIPTTLRKLKDAQDALGQTIAPPPPGLAEPIVSAATLAGTVVGLSAPPLPQVQTPDTFAGTVAGVPLTNGSVPAHAAPAHAAPAHAAPAHAADMAGQIQSLAGRYEVLRMLGEGGMGQVFLAEDTTLGRRVALKKLPPELVAHDAMRERFRREARALAQLNHAHVVQLFDFLDISQSTGPDRGMWMVMEVVSGGDLEGRLEHGAIEIAEVCRLGQQMAQALAAAHARGIVHRDFKPANVMLTETGDAKVTDFGIAQLEAASAGIDTKLTQAGTVMGTPTYMSPEQARGDAVGAASDVYALGATLYEMLAARPVFTGTLTQVLAAHILQPPEPILSVVEDLPASLGQLVMDMLAKAPEQRPNLEEATAILASV